MASTSGKSKKLETIKTLTRRRKIDKVQRSLTVEALMSNTDRVKILFVPAGGITRLDQLDPANTLKRCEHALKMWNTKEYDHLVVTGGKFLSPDIQTAPAGQLMAEWFNAHGVNSTRIIIEEDSLDTYENISGSVIAMEDCKLSDSQRWDITVVTQWQHSWRFWISFWNMYGIRIEREPLSYPMSFMSWIMEFAMIAYHFYDPCGTGVIARKNRENRRRAAAGE